MLNELLFTLFLTQVGTVAVITACIVGAIALFCAETNALDKCDAEKPLEAPRRPFDEYARGIHGFTHRVI